MLERKSIARQHNQVILHENHADAGHDDDVASKYYYTSGSIKSSVFRFFLGIYDRNSVGECEQWNLSFPISRRR